jgi:hypothetical protein
MKNPLATTQNEKFLFTHFHTLIQPNQLSKDTISLLRKGWRKPTK